MTNQKKIEEFEELAKTLVKSKGDVNLPTDMAIFLRQERRETTAKLLSLFKEAILKLELCEKSRTLGERLAKAGSDEKRREILAEGKELQDALKELGRFLKGKKPAVDLSNKIRKGGSSPLCINKESEE